MTRPRPPRVLTSLIPEPGATRVYGLAVLANTFGFGLILTSSVLYFTRVVHLPVGRVGLGLTIAGLIGLAAGIPIGDLADRRDPRQVLRMTMLVQFAATAGYVFVRNFAGFVVVATVDMLAMNAAESAEGALIRRVGGEDATVFRSATRAISNVGISLGAVGCGIAVQIGTPDAYRALIIGNALSFLAAWAVCGRLPRYTPLPRPPEARAGLMFLLSCSAIGLAAHLPAWPALLLLAGAIVVHSLGETSHAAASFALDFGMAPVHAQGQYQGLAGLGIGAGAAAAPVVMIGLCLTYGAAGWIGLGAFFALLGVAAPAIARWGERTRPDAGLVSAAEQARVTN